MADSPTTKASLDANLKYVQEQMKDLIPENSVLLKTFPTMQKGQRIGRKFLCPVQVAPEQGFSYGDGTAFSLNEAVAGVYEEIELDATPIVLNSQISESAGNRLANKEVFLGGEGVNRVLGMLDSLSRRAEISMLYGQSGIATTASSVNIGATSTTVTFTEASWSDGIWASAINAKLHFYNGASLVSSSTDAVFTVTSVDPDNYAAVITGTATGITALDSGIAAGARTAYFQGSKSNDMLGLNGQIVGGAAYFGIDPTVYPLWQGCTYSAGDAALSMSKVLAAVAKPVARGGLNSDAELHVCAATFANLASDQAALRAYDSGYSSKTAENGAEKLVFHAANGKVTVVINNIVKRGEAFLLPVKNIRRIGAKEIGWVDLDGKGSYCKMMESVAAWQLRMSMEWAILLDAPAKACKITNIVNS